ncbi:TSUP family transporter [Parashewanella tropica]|uniref:TSUP family transporter n=1 Tax=Parashewanella tropica TaxID=2547970 RepID=UPI0010599F7A|nr:TSUP family transporter [Parashewanella tropica]
MDFELTIQIALILFTVAALAGFIDSIAGGGGLLTIPALMWAGLPPVAALATNKLQASAGSFFASWYFIRHGAVKLKTMWLAVGCAFVGSALGAFAVQQIDAEILKVILPFLIFGIGLYFLFSKKLSDDDKHQVLTPTLFAFTAAIGVGFYDGFFGPGTGSFFALAFVMLYGFGLGKATAHAKLLNFSTNIASLIIFIIGGHVVWLLGLTMMVGQALGANLGSRLVLSKGTKLIRPMVVTMSLAMSIKLLSDQFTS